MRNCSKFRNSIKPTLVKAFNDIAAVLQTNIGQTYNLQKLEQKVENQQQRIESLEDRLQRSYTLTRQENVTQETIGEYSAATDQKTSIGLQNKMKNDVKDAYVQTLVANTEDISKPEKLLSFGLTESPSCVTHQQGTHEEESLVTKENGDKEEFSTKSRPQTTLPFKPESLLEGMKNLRKRNEKPEGFSERPQNKDKGATTIKQVNPSALLGAKAKLRSQHKMQEKEDTNTEGHKLADNEDGQTKTNGISASVLLSAKGQLRSHKNKSTAAAPKGRQDPVISSNLLQSAKKTLKSCGNKISSEQGVQTSSNSPMTRMITSQALLNAKRNLKSPVQQGNNTNKQGKRPRTLLEGVLNSSMLQRFQESMVSELPQNESTVVQDHHTSNFRSPDTGISAPRKCPNSDNNARTGRVAFSPCTNIQNQNAGERRFTLHESSLTGIKSALRSTPMKRSPGGTPSRSPKKSCPSSRKSLCHGDLLKNALAKRFAAIHGSQDSPSSSTDSEESTGSPLRTHLL